MTKIAQKKSDARKQALLRRKEAHDPERSAQAALHLLAELDPFRGKIIAGYMPIRTEIDPRPAMAAMAAFGPVVVPVIQGDGLPLVFRAWTPDCKMLDGPFGALVPATGEFLEPDVLVVPLVAFDKKGRRLGYGGGFYDRTLEQLNAISPRRVIGFGYAGQEAKRLPSEKTDITLDMIVTEDGVRRFG